MRTRVILGLIFLMYSFAVFAAPGRASLTAGKTVTISNFQFAPKNVTVKVGTVVTWNNKEGTHTVTADNGSFQSPNLTAGKTFSYTFTKAGTYRYYCSFHGGAGGAEMSGVITVTK